MRLENNYLGLAKLQSKDTVIAGSITTVEIEYTVGDYGIDEFGSLKLSWRGVSDWEHAQFTDPKGYAFTTAVTDGEAELTLQSTHHVRPFHWGVLVGVTNGSLKKGDIIKITLGDTSQGSPGIRAQSFREDKHEFRLFVDPAASQRYELLEPVITIKIVNAPPNEIQIVVPSTVKVGQPFEGTVRVLDENGNPCSDFEGEVKLGTKNGVTDMTLPETAKIKENGFTRFKGVVNKEGSYHLTGYYDRYKLKCESNGIKCQNDSDYNLYWGDAHGQTDYTVGTGSIEQYFDYAKGPAALDFSGWQGNDFEITPKTWNDVREKTKLHNEEGKFITFLGYEWSGNHCGGGDHNVYFLEDSKEYYPHSNWLRVEENGNKNNRYPLNELMDEFRNRKDVNIIPHIGGRPANLDFFDPEFIRVIEIHSHHGTFEWFAVEAMKRGLEVGFIGTSDDHTCRPGLSYPLKSFKDDMAGFDTANGLTAVYAKDLTRNSIWEAIINRRVYATTLGRIFLGVNIGNAFMGEKTESGEIPKLDIDVIGSSDIRAIEIFNGTEKISDVNYERNPNIDKFKRVKVVWEGVIRYGRSKSALWNGTISINKGKIVNAGEKAFDRSAQGLRSVTTQWVDFVSSTSGDIDSLVFDLDCDMDTVLSFDSKNINFKVSLDDLRNGKVVTDCPGVNTKVTTELITEDCPKEYDINTYSIKTSFIDENVRKGKNSYWVKILQEDGNMAWSSPIFYCFK